MKKFALGVVMSTVLIGLGGGGHAVSHQADGAPASTVTTDNGGATFQADGLWWP